MTACEQIVGDPNSIYPVATGRMHPGTTEAHQHDASTLDCAGTGVTIIGVIAAINANDDDGLLTLGASVIDADLLGWTQFVTAAADETQRIYTVTYTVTLSDTQQLKYDETISVIPTRLPYV